MTKGPLLGVGDCVQGLPKLKVPKLDQSWISICQKFKKSFFRI